MPRVSGKARRSRKTEGQTRTQSVAHLAFWQRSRQQYLKNNTMVVHSDAAAMVVHSDAAASSDVFGGSGSGGTVSAEVEHKEEEQNLTQQLEDVIDIESELECGQPHVRTPDGQDIKQSESERGERGDRSPGDWPWSGSWPVDEPQSKPGKEVNGEPAQMAAERAVDQTAAATEVDCQDEVPTKTATAARGSRKAAAKAGVKRKSPGSAASAPAARGSGEGPAQKKRPAASEGRPAASEHSSPPRHAVKTPASFGEFSPVIPPPMPTCSRCKVQVDVLKQRVQIKSRSNMVCPSCNSKGVALSRAFGKWPPRSFANLSSDWQTKFWKDVAGVKGSEALKELVVQSITTKRVEEESCKFGGSFLPLSVYAQQGYDTAMIKKHCSPRDIEEHPVLGTTYKVAIRSVFSTTIEAPLM